MVSQHQAPLSAHEEILKYSLEAYIKDWFPCGRDRKNANPCLHIEGISGVPSL